ncbi:MAG TPA: hypothetical protein VF712_15440 [Thermoleophilaceae bacterium]|jgi:hypothetical protein
MRKRLLAVCVAAGALAAANGAPAQAATARCTARNAQTIAATNSARIYATPLGDGASRIYGCLYSRNRRYLLGNDGDCDPGPVVSRLTLRGRYVAFVETFCNIDASDDYVAVKDLRTGRNKWRAISATGNRAENGEPSTLVSDIALSPTGSVAWIADWEAVSGGNSSPQDDRQVRKLEPGAPAGGALLDSGLGIEQRSLAIGSRSSSGYSRIYWTKDDAPAAAKLN